jgi:hypothetical protein
MSHSVTNFGDNFVANFVTNFEACDWSMWFMQVILLSSHWLTMLRPGWRQVAVKTADGMYTECT